jgi:N-acetylneuraminate epimerase
MAGHAGGIVEGLPVMVGGSSWALDKSSKRWLRDCFVFQAGQWKSAPSFPRPLSDPAYASADGTLYVIGGTDGTNESTEVLALHDLSKGWQQLTPLPFPLEAAAAVVLSQKLYVFGGFSQKRALNDLWSLNLQAKDAAWQKCAACPAEGRGYCAMTLVGSQIYVFGGFTSPPYAKQVSIFDDAYCYDPASNQWSKLGLASFPGYAWTAVAASPTEVLLAGRVSQVGQVNDDLWLVNLKSLETHRIGKLITPNCCAPLIPLGERTWWYAGGEPDTNRSRSDRTSVIQLNPGDQP